ncbi:MAG: hypothetical protein WB562_06110 [Candidatus Sulfotelmatobacter sp.]
MGKIYGIDPVESAKKILDELNAGDYLRVFSRIVFCGLVGDFNSKDIDMPYTRAQISEWIAEMNMNEFEPVWKCWQDTLILPEIIKDQNQKIEEAELPKKKKQLRSKIK